MNDDRQAERDRIIELEELLNKEQSTREQELQQKIEEEQRKLEEAEQALVEEEERRKAEEEEQTRLIEEQRLQMEEMQRQMDEERQAREEAERELGMRQEEQGKEDEAADLAEQAAEVKKEPPLIWAVKEGDVFAVRGLVRRHPDALHAQDKNQRTALHFVHEPECTSALLKARADPNAQDMGMWTPLHNAVQRGCRDVSKLIMEASGNVLLTTRHNNTAIDLAYNNAEITKVLLSQLPEIYNTLEVDVEPETAPQVEAPAGPGAALPAAAERTPAGSGNPLTTAEVGEVGDEPP